MRYLQTKANKIVKLVVEWELARSVLKYVAFNTLLPYELRQFAVLSLANLPIHTSLHHLKLRCVTSNQPRSILTFFKLNRMHFKVAAASGLLHGVKKKMF